MNHSLTSPSALRRVVLLCALATGVAQGAPAQEEQGKPAPSTLVIGLETTHHVSGPFKEQYYDAVEFASYYIYAHLNGLGGLRVPTALFVASIGGGHPGEPKSFHLIQDFTSRTPAQIAAALRAWFPPRDAFTDFNPRCGPSAWAETRASGESSRRWSEPSGPEPRCRSRRIAWPVT
jgi:hypothetical protein